MKEMLLKALNGQQEEKETVVAQIKALPRNLEGIFDTTSIDSNIYLAGGLIYPLYAEYETKVNSKAGYPDIMNQMRVLNKKVNDQFVMENVAPYLHMLIDTIEKISPEIYENYRELVDMFRACAKKAITEFALDAQKLKAGIEKEETAKILGEAMDKACNIDVLLKEKYEALVEAMLK